MHLGLFGVIAHRQADFGHNVAGGEDALPTHTHKEHVEFFNHGITSVSANDANTCTCVRCKCEREQ